MTGCTRAAASSRPIHSRQLLRSAVAASPAGSVLERAGAEVECGVEVATANVSALVQTTNCSASMHSDLQSHGELDPRTVRAVRGRSPSDGTSNARKHIRRARAGEIARVSCAINPSVIPIPKRPPPSGSRGPRPSATRRSRVGSPQSVVQICPVDRAQVVGATT
jgi:hypothetical protein